MIADLLCIGVILMQYAVIVYQSRKIRILRRTGVAISAAAFKVIPTEDLARFKRETEIQIIKLIGKD